MKSKLLMFSMVALLASCSSVAARSSPEVTLVGDFGATKVVKAVSLENVIEHVVAQDLKAVQALVIVVGPEFEYFAYDSAIEPVNVLNITPESTALRVTAPEKIVGNYFSLFKPPSNQKQLCKIYLNNCAIRQC